MEQTSSKRNIFIGIIIFIIVAIYTIFLISFIEVLIEKRNADNLELENSEQHSNMALNLPFESYVLEDIGMPIEHQKYLYKLCNKYQLDYIKVLGLIKHESQFNVNAISHTDDYGYMQINKVNHKNLSEKLKTDNKPLDPYINMEWGTYMLSKLYSEFEYQGLDGKDLDESVWSAYNKGVAGFTKYGRADRYISRTYKEIDWIKAQLDLN